MRNSAAAHALAFTLVLFGCEPDSGDNELVESDSEVLASPTPEPSPAIVEQVMIPETATLIRTLSNMSFSGGNVLIEPEAETSCRSFNVTFDLAFTADGASAADRSDLMFYEGVTFSFRGDTCIPAQGSIFTMSKSAYSTKMDEEGSMTPGGTLLGGPIVSGPGKRSGTASLVVVDGQAVFQFTTAPAADPLVLELTSGGFRHVSGCGVVITPDGKKYEF